MNRYDNELAVNEWNLAATWSEFIGKTNWEAGNKGIFSCLTLIKLTVKKTHDLIKS
ncbi:hypothetical protein [Fulvivirga lutimaris]|uniref:hypothetical protein n=1 Tax=Fulvivirga lutimaris TaxID=1819566 RepID=UPI0012BC4321|nr:hypothetical protein [Fulvivirga lutimaris]